MPSISEMPRRVAIAALSPFKFATETSHFRNALRGYPTDKDGGPVPWYTYPAVDFLSMLDFSDARVCEYGGGQSTLWWAARAKSVLSIEQDRDWYERVSGSLSTHANIDFVLEPDRERYADVAAGRTFDVVVVDGGPRVRCAAMALETITDEGLVIIDNSEANWAPAPSYPIIEMFDEAGWARVDFHGYAASAWRQQCTSFMFKDPGFFKGLAPPPRKYEVMDGQHNQLRRPWDRRAAPAAGTPTG